MGLPFKREPQSFVSKGLDLNAPIDSMRDGKYPILRNVRSYQNRSLQGRVGVKKVNTSAIADQNIHSFKRVNDYFDVDSFSRYLGAQTKLYQGTTSFAQIDTGYSGDPLSFVPYRPESSIRVQTYIANFDRMRKADSNGTVDQIGIFPPITPPSMELLQPLYAAPSSFNTAAGWGNGTPAGAVTLGARLTGVTIGSILYISGTTGWAAIQPSGGNVQDIQPGMRIIINSGGGTSERTTVEEVHKVYDSGTNTIAAIIYDSGTTGLCTIQPTQALTGIRRNALLVLGGLAERIRVISVTDGPNGISSFRCSTVNNHVATDSITAPSAGSFWVYTVNNHLAAETLTADFLTSTLSPVTAPTTGFVHFNLGSPGNNLGNINGRPIGPDDYIHISVRIDNPARLVEGKLVLDVDRNTTSTFSTNDGKRNAYYKTFRASEFQPVLRETVTSDSARTKAIQLEKQNETDLDINTTLNPDGSFGTGESSTPIDVVPIAPSSPEIPSEASPSTALILGESQWTEFRWKIADLVRIGSDQSSDLSDVRAIQLRFTVTADVIISIADLWVGGTYGTDTGTDLTPMLYRYRYRSSTTGAKSLPGPATRSGIQALRQGIRVIPAASTDPQVDKIDLERLGGNNLEWHYVGTAPNSSPTFDDDQFSAAVLVNPALDTDAYQPFPLPGTPKSMTVTLAGTAVTRTGGTDTFDVSWARGTEVIINGKRSTLYASPTSTTLLHINDSLGSGTALSMEVPEPIQQGKPLPVMWGPFMETLFATGSGTAPANIYFTKANDPDSAPVENFIEIESPSETVMNGLVFDNRCYAFTDKRMGIIVPKFDSLNKFQWVEIPNGKGLFARWAFAVGPKIWFLAADGIYETVGGEPVSISDDIRPLFPYGDSPGVVTNGFNPIRMVNPAVGGEQSNLRLTYHNKFLYFDYLDSAGVPSTLVYDTEEKAWYYDEYFVGSSPHRGFVSHFSETGIIDGDEVNTLIGTGNDGFIYVHEGTKDDTLAISGQIRTPAKNLGDFRAKKVYGDIVLDLDANSVGVSVVPNIDNYKTALAGVTFSGPDRVVTDPIDINSGGGQFARNLGLDITWSSDSAQPQFFSWEPSYVERPEDTFRRADDWSDGGKMGGKYIRGFLLEADTEGKIRSVKLQGDQNDIQTFLNVQHSGHTVRAYALSSPTIATLLRILPTDDIPWREFRVSYIYDDVPEDTPLITPYQDGGYRGAKFVQGVLIEALGTDSDVTIQKDGDVNFGALSLAHTASSYPYTKPYSFVPFIAHQMRLKPSVAIRIGKVDWVWEPSPELTTTWKTQGTNHDIPGFQFLKDGYIAHISTANLSLVITVDGVPFTYPIPHGSNVYTKSYILFQIDGGGRTLKGKIFDYSLTSPEGFRLFQKDCEVRVHPWAGGGYQIKNPFGDAHRIVGARI